MLRRLLRRSGRANPKPKPTPNPNPNPNPNPHPNQGEPPAQLREPRRCELDTPPTCTSPPPAPTGTGVVPSTRSSSTPGPFAMHFNGPAGRFRSVSKAEPSTRFGQNGAGQASTTPKDAPGCRKLRPASANQPLGPRWPATSCLLFTQVSSRLVHRGADAPCRLARTVPSGRRPLHRHARAQQLRGRWQQRRRRRAGRRRRATGCARAATRLLWRCTASLHRARAHRAAAAAGAPAVAMRGGSPGAPWMHERPLFRTGRRVVATHRPPISVYDS